MKVKVECKKNREGGEKDGQNSGYWGSANDGGGDNQKELPVVGELQQRGSCVGAVGVAC